jgi:NifU-like protein involved in Fe-S cluster formation
MASRAGALYTPAILAAAAGLASFPWDESIPLRGEARSRSCGSAIGLALGTDGQGRIERIGIRPHACAVGQAAAHVFATGAKGHSHESIAAARAALAAWLAGEGPRPSWPGLELIEPALAFPARHGAIVLAWDAALAALS